MILISNNSELAAKYLPNEVDQSITNSEILNFNNDVFQGFDIKKEKVVSIKEWEYAETSEIKKINNDKNFHYTTVNSAKQLFQIYNSYFQKRLFHLLHFYFYL